MKKSLHIDLSAHFGAAVPTAKWQGGKPRLQIRHAITHYYAYGVDIAIEQEFDGYRGYLYSYEMRLRQAISIPVHVDRADMHVLYFVESNTAIKLKDNIRDICVIGSQRARYLYLPAGEYTLHFPEGELLLFGFYFDGRIFRAGNERPFGFIANLIQAHRHRSTRAYSSIDFKVGKLTRAKIQHICAYLKANDLFNEAFILDGLIQLIKLSRDKVYNEYERVSDPKLLIQRCRELLSEEINRIGNNVKIKAIAAQLHVSPAYLSRLHQKYYGQRINDYREELLLRRIQVLLAQPITLLDVSLQCNFHGPSELSRFFKKKMGLTPIQYRKTLQTE